ncbi:MAG: HDIG domain-containing protein [Anaerolineae bacterium]|nr:HDIG domain-containing protein [Anaerolineae bacterium]
MALLLASVLLSILALLAPLTTRPLALPLGIGDVAPQDILAPQTINYQSEVLTAQRAEVAAEAVDPIYAPPNTSTARQQVKRLRAALTFIATVRQDSFASPEQKLADLAALQDINIGQESAQEILALSEANWQSVQQEAITVLEQVMRSTIRDDRLEDARRGVPALVSLSLPEDQADLVAELVAAFITPNSLYSEAATQSAREEARKAVEPVTQTFIANETVVLRGQVITAVDLEALQAMGLVQPSIRWQDQVSVVTLVAACFALMVLYLRFRPDLLSNSRGMAVIAIIFLLFLYGARLTIPERTVIPYLFPLAGFSLVVTVLFSSQAAMVLTVPLGILAAYGFPNSLDLTLYYVISSLFGVLVLKRAQRITTFFWAGAAIAGAGAALVIAYRLPEPATDIIGLATLVGASVFNGLAAASITIILQFFLAQMLGLTTTLQLHEISRADHPLLQFILRNAPGTYQHSLQIANLAEQAADLIGAEALLTRVGALYHDAGKARYPHFFIENQVPGNPNPHDDLSPQESAAIILRHVPDGLELARKHRLPRRIQDFIAEHHGTMLTKYQYAKAVEAHDGDSSKVDESLFHYQGPSPQSRETALVMLADGVEARARAERPQSREALHTLIKSVIDNRIASGQFDNTGLTMKDLKIITESFTTTLRGVYHPRIKYPKSFQDNEPDEALDVSETTPAAA